MTDADYAEHATALVRFECPEKLDMLRVRVEPTVRLVAVAMVIDVLTD